uniref:Uncharacterized protein n=1 Tax=Arundo donax TaxID=35708 RepID=A0A0A9GXT0_ARUDO
MDLALQTCASPSNRVSCDHGCSLVLVGSLCTYAL